ncbi:MAG: ATP-binding cassette domain-containing protein [Candidatus Pacebacteria bacterium]|nr:ATP-binding cassette domain-containing protein [Candidatus Paceibacterota bacterium]
MAKNSQSRSTVGAFTGDTVLRFEDVSFEHGHNHFILDEVNFTVRRGTKVTLMGQNGAGKSTIFGLILGAEHAGNTTEGHKPESGSIYITNGCTVATARQVIPRPDLELTVRDFFANCFADKVYDLDPRIDAVLEVVNLNVHKTAKSEKVLKDTPSESADSAAGSHASRVPKRPSKSLSDSAALIDVKDRQVKTFSGGQQARLLLASALIQDPDILLLDEPTNNLDKAGIEHLTDFLINYKKTCIVISHDADFLNAFTHGVLYLDIHTKKIEQYVGDYKDVIDQITARIEKENMKNAQLEKQIQANKDQANVFANKGGQMRLVAKRMREKAEELEEEIVDVRREDKTIKQFTIPSQPDLIGEIINISSYTALDLKTHKPVKHNAKVALRKRNHLLISGPNGIGKSTLIEKIYAASNPATPVEGIKIMDGVRVGYYRQDFSMMDFNDTVYQSLEKIIRSVDGRFLETELRATAAAFLITGEMVHKKIGSLSEGQKGLVAFARLVLLRPGLLIMDEPTNHINFRHIPVIAKALDAYEGALIMVSHVHDFVSQIKIDQTLEMGK